MIYFYCEVCGDHQEVDIEPLKKKGDHPCPWGDIVCKACHFVIATCSADVECKVVFLPAVTEKEQSWDEIMDEVLEEYAEAWNKLADL